MFSDEPDDSKEAYAQLGSNIGTIFQLNDDCADYEASERLSKKPVLWDYSRGVVTLPLIYALKKDAALRGKIAAGIAPTALADAVTTAGGLKYTHAKIDALYKKTGTLLDSLDIGADKTDLLRSLLRKASGVTA
jgi:heptaprenyl diphosphate synthase